MEKRSSGAEAPLISLVLFRGLKPPAPSVLSFSASCGVVPFHKA